MDEILQVHFFIAIKEGNITLLEDVISKGVDVNSDCMGLNSLLYAIENGKKNCIEPLLKAGVNINILNNNNLTPLMMAIKKKDKHIVDLLMKKGANVNQCMKETQRTALMFASECGYDDIIEILLKGGADLHMSDCCGETALMKASAEGHLSSMKLLINSGASVNEGNVFTRSPLLEATFFNRTECMKFLISAGAEVNFFSDYFVDFFCDIDIFFSPYCFAASQARLESVKILLSAGAYINTGFNSSEFLNCLTLEIDDPNEQTEMVEVLHASGQEIDPVYKKQIESYSPQLQEESTLKNLCRESIRKHLINLDKYSHLYNRIPRIGFPKSLKDYLLYNTSLSSD